MKNLPDHRMLEEISYLLTLHIAGLLDEKGKIRLQEISHEFGLSAIESARIVHRIGEKEEFDYLPAYAQFRQGTLRKKGKHRRRVIRFCFAAVAVLALFVGVGLLLKLKSSSVNSSELKTTTLIVPGCSKAFITLASGEKIELGKIKQTLQEQDGTWLTFDSAGIQYKGHNENGQEIYNTLTVPLGGEYRLILSDGSKVWMNAGSVLKYPIHFTGQRREVFLEGEGYFEVEKDEAHPFLVHTSRGVVRVVGTGFNVRDYPDENKVVTTLAHGSIVYRPEIQHGKEISLQPGYQVEDGADSGLTYRPVEVEMYTGWKDGKYIFEDTTLEEIMQVLSRWYDIEVFYKREGVKSLHFTGDLERYQTINDFLEFLEIGGNIRFTVKGKIVTVE